MYCVGGWGRVCVSLLLRGRPAGRVSPPSRGRRRRGGLKSEGAAAPGSAAPRAEGGGGCSSSSSPSPRRVPGGQRSRSPRRAARSAPPGPCGGRRQHEQRLQQPGGGGERGVLLHRPHLLLRQAAGQSPARPASECRAPGGAGRATSLPQALRGARGGPEQPGPGPGPPRFAARVRAAAVPARGTRLRAPAL